MSIFFVLSLQQKNIVSTAYGNVRGVPLEVATITDRQTITTPLTSFRNLPLPMPPRRVDCQLCRARAIMIRVRDDLPANQVYKPVCEGRLFAHQQYNEYKNEVFCVEKNGEEIPGSRQKGKNVNCKKFSK